MITISVPPLVASIPGVTRPFPGDGDSSVKISLTRPGTLQNSAPVFATGRMVTLSTTVIGILMTGSFF
jgi:hypothetical protein